MKKIIKISNGKNSAAISALGKLDPNQDWKITIEEWDYKRSIDQNKRYWEMLGQLGYHLGYTADEMHQLLTYKYLSYKSIVMDNEVVVVPSTTSLSVKEFGDYMNNVENFASSLGFNFGY